MISSSMLMLMNCLKVKLVNPEAPPICIIATHTPIVAILMNIHSLYLEDLVHPVGTLNPRAELTCAFDVTGLKVGTHSIVVGLDCDKTEMITAKKDVSACLCVCTASSLIDALSLSLFNFRSR